MPEPCRSCERREIDFGGCRCQAFLLTGDAANTDPVCSLSPHHQRLVNFVERSVQHPDGAVFDFKRVSSSIRFRTYPVESE